MSVTPAVLTQEVLTQREAQPICLIQSEEILRVKTPAYSKTNSDVSFMVRQPSASAILANDVELYLEVSFEIAANAFRVLKDQPGTDYKNIAQQDTDYGFIAEGLPVQSKCVRNAVLTINGSSQSFRMNEFGKEYALMHGSKKYMNKIGNDWNDFTKLHCNKDFGVAAYLTDVGDIIAMNPTQAKQFKAWKQQMCADGINQGAGGTNTNVFQIREKLFMGPFGAFGKCDSFPAWSSEGQKSPGLLHVHNMQLQLALEDNWQNALFLPVQMENTTGDNTFNHIVSATIHKAELHTKWILPPPRLVSAALTQSVSYASFDVLRFVADPPVGLAASLLKEGNTAKFQLNAVSFPYMPSLFCFSVCPHYAHCTKYIAGKAGVPFAIEAMKRDTRLTITHMDLSINTSSAAVPYVGGDSQKNKRINARDLYYMTLENCASMEGFPYDFEDWRQYCGFVALTPAQLSGQLNSPNIRGNVVLQGSIYCQNNSGAPVNVSRQDQNMGEQNVYPNDKLPRYQCVVSGFYTNRALVLDAKSGIINESTYSAAFQQNLRLGTGGA